MEHATCKLVAVLLIVDGGVGESLLRGRALELMQILYAVLIFNAPLNQCHLTRHGEHGLDIRDLVSIIM